MLFVLLYVVLFTIVWDKGYQDTDQVTGTTSIKLKGSASIGDENGPLDDLIPFDAMDLVQPPMEENAFFIITARTITPNQTRSNCPGNEDVPTCTPTDVSNCIENLYDPDSQGLYTGNCADNGHCEMYSWCPLENDTAPQLINNVGAFTAFIKIDVNFANLPGGKISRNNIYNDSGPFPTDGYNLFSIDEMLNRATNGEVTSYKNVSRRGAIILVSSVWNCDFDKPEDECNPKFEFSRIDGQPRTISSGFNFRTVTYDTSETTRYLRKYYGLRFIFIVEGQGGKFDIFATTVTFGAGLAYLSLAALIADIVLENFLTESESYAKAKMRDLDGLISMQKAPLITDDTESELSIDAGRGGYTPANIANGHK